MDKSKQHELKTLDLHIGGMHCINCEVAIERRLKGFAGVQRVRVSHRSGIAKLQYSGDLDHEALRLAIAEEGYALQSSNARQTDASERQGNTLLDYVQIGATFVILLAIWGFLERFDLVPKGFAVLDQMSYGFVFAIGLAASVSSCLAVTGGLLVALAARYNEAMPAGSGFEKLKPHLYFNAGRIVSYTLLGGLVGALGSTLTLSSWMTGIVTILASIVMILLGAQMLKLLPGKFLPKMPKFLAHRIHDMAGREGKSGAFALGASTFFLPCGFTQALQLYVLAKGSFTIGALTMLAFSLGTLPGLLSLSMLSSFVRGAFQKYFVRFAAAVVIMLGFWNIQNGLTLTGLDFPAYASVPSNESTAGIAAKAATIVDGKQIVDMKVIGLDYAPSQFTVQAGIPVEWRVDGREARGCAQILVARNIRVTKYLSHDKITTIAFTPDKTGTIPFSCSMGMTTYGAHFTVVPAVANTAAQAGDVVKNIATDTPLTTGQASGVTAPSATVEPQKIATEISNEKGFFPHRFFLQKGIPVDWTIDDKAELDGCTSVLVIAKYDVTVPLQLGINKVAFTPTESGQLYATCSMGIKMVQFIVTD